MSYLIYVATNGYLSTALSISVEGYLGNSIGGGSVVGSIIENRPLKKINNRQLILEDDKEILLLIKIFSRWL